MKKSTIIAAIASAMLLAAPQQAEAQFLKKLGKAISDKAKETWDKAKEAATDNQSNGATEKSSSFKLSTEGNGNIKNPNLTVTLVSCVRNGNEVMATYNVTNNNATDRSYEILNCDVLDLEYHTMAYDEKGKRHLIDFIFNDKRIHTNIDCMAGVSLPHGITVPLVMVVKFVDPSIKKMARLQLAFNQYKFTAENIPIEEPAQTDAGATDANNLNVLGISLGQSKSAVESQLKAKGFKDVMVYDSKELQGSFYGKTAAVYVYEYDGKVTVALRDVNSYSLSQAKARVEQLKQQLQGNGTAKKWTGMGISDPSYRIIQKSGKIEIEYHDEDEENGDSGSYTVTCKFCNQDFTEE
ncbi:MAG: hypothetical protein J5971_09060 [Prevotella sp.]|nr:hypothetical protein [Prevotella sp.]